MDDKSPTSHGTGPPDISAPMHHSKSIETKMRLKVALDNLAVDLADIQEDINKVDNWRVAQDHQIIAGMMSRKTWKPAWARSSASRGVS